MLLVPAHRWAATSLTGDEPKYLRMSLSLYHDLDVDMASDTLQPMTAGLLWRNVRSFAGSTRGAVADLFASTDSREARSTGHNWTIEGRHGGRYYVQSPGLPLLLLPAVALQGLASWSLPMLILAALWATALAHTVRLCVESGASASGAMLTGGIALFSVPAFIGGMHFYPESAALPAIAWIARYARPAGPRPGRWRSVCLAAALGAMPWLHPKLIPVAAVLGLLLAVRLRSDRRALCLVLAAGLVPFLALLLFQHHVTGLARPDALYVVYGSEVYGGLGALVSPRIATGLVNGLFAARDGLLILAPCLIAGALALPLLWRHDRRSAIALGLVFGAVWFVAAIHEGGAPGPAARLMAPAIPILAVPLALGLEERGRALPFRWTLVALALIALAMTSSFLTDWLRTTNPYRGIPQEANFAPDLPDGPRDLALSPPEARRLPDLARGLLLAGAIGLWSFFLCRRPLDPELPPPDPWPQVMRTHLAWWSTIALLSWLLHALGP